MKTKRMKREEAEVRQAAADAMSHVERLGRLDKQLGLNVGAKKERSRLARFLPKDIRVKKDRDSSV